VFIGDINGKKDGGIGGLSPQKKFEDHALHFGLECISQA